MTTSAYSTVGPALIQAGYSAIPITPGDKRPAVAKGWQEYCLKAPAAATVDAWVRADRFGVGVACGFGGLVAIDLDSDRDDFARKVDSITGLSSVVKVGRRGKTSFFRTSKPISSARIPLDDSGEGLDVLALGKQAVIPPTIHPNTQMPYLWIGSTLDAEPVPLWDVKLADLPTLPDDIASRLAAAFNFELAPERTYTKAPAGVGDSWREVNEAALANLGAWVPALGLDAKRHGQGYRCAARWRNGANDSAVSFNPAGICDFGDDAGGRRKGYSAIDVAAVALSLDFGGAKDWLEERLGIEKPLPAAFAFKISSSIPDDDTEGKSVMDSTTEDVTGAVSPLNFPAQQPDVFDPDVAGGLLGQTAEWIYSASFVRSREMSMMAAIGVMAAFMGRRYKGPTGLSPNLYLVALKRTAAGGNGPLSKARELLSRPELDYLRGSGDTTSDAAIERVVRRSPSCLFVMDEIGAWLQSSAGKNAAPYAKQIRKSLLELYSVSGAGGVWSGKDRAGDETLSSDSPVYSPCFSLFGVSTAEGFYKGLTEENLADGLINRLILFHVNLPLDDDVPLDRGAPPPQSLIDAFKDATAAWSATNGNLAVGFCKTAGAPAPLQEVPFADAEAHYAAKLVKASENDMITSGEFPAGVAGRRLEQALKFAMIRAVARDFARPAITAGDVYFGDMLAYLSIHTHGEGINEHLYGSDFEKLQQDILRRVKSAGREFMPKSHILKGGGIKGKEDRRIEAAIKRLVDLNLLERSPTGNAYRWTEK